MSLTEHFNESSFQKGDLFLVSKSVHKREKRGPEIIFINWPTGLSRSYCKVQIVLSSHGNWRRHSCAFHEMFSVCSFKTTHSHTSPGKLIKEVSTLVRMMASSPLHNRNPYLPVVFDTSYKSTKCFYLDLFLSHICASDLWIFK